MLGVTLSSSFNPRLDKAETGVASPEFSHRNLGGTRSSSQQSIGLHASKDMNATIFGAANGARINQSLWSYLSANTAEEQSSSLINAMSNAELFLQLLDTAQIISDIDLDMDGVEVHFTGSADVIGGLLPAVST